MFNAWEGSQMFRRLLVAVAVSSALSTPLARAQDAAADEAARPVAQPITVHAGDALAAVETQLAGYEVTERIAVLGPSGRYDYLGVRAGGELPNAALVFRDGRLVAAIGEPERKLFAACRTLASSRGTHWMRAGFEPYLPMLAAREAPAALAIAPPAPDASIAKTLISTTERSLTTVESLSGLVPTALNPGSIPRTVRSWVKTAREQVESNARVEVLKRVPIGQAEGTLVAAIGVDWARVEDTTPLLWYRKESFEVLMRDGAVAGVEFPARYERLERATGGYYEPGVDWSRCPMR
jgi:hypothetical protein